MRAQVVLRSVALCHSKSHVTLKPAEEITINSPPKRSYEPEI